MVLLPRCFPAVDMLELEVTEQSMGRGKHWRQEPSAHPGGVHGVVTVVFRRNHTVHTAVIKRGASVLKLEFIMWESELTL